MEEVKVAKDEAMKEWHKIRNEPTRRKRQNDALESILAGMRRRKAEQGTILANKEIERCARRRCTDATSCHGVQRTSSRTAEGCRDRERSSAVVDGTGTRGNGGVL